jgi:hypothetical protein
MSSVGNVLGEMRRFLEDKEVAESVEFELAQEVDRGYRRSVSCWHKAVEFYGDYVDK